MLHVIGLAKFPDQIDAQIMLVYFLSSSSVPKDNQVFIMTFKNRRFLFLHMYQLNWSDHDNVGVALYGANRSEKSETK